MSIVKWPSGVAIVTSLSGSWLVQTVNFVKVVLPNEVVSATSTASRPRPISTRPMRGSLCRASSVCQPSPR